TTADSRLRGWLGGSTPDTTFHLEFFASSAFLVWYNGDRAGEANDYLGSLDVTTDGQGQAIFDVPFMAPSGLPIITATATDPQGNTSEVSAARRGVLDLAAPSVRLPPDQPSLLFSAASGDGIALEDQDAGPFDPVWDLTLSVAVGTLSLS